MRYCEHCGARTSYTAKFCPKCGKNIQIESPVDKKFILGSLTNAGFVKDAPSPVPASQVKLVPIKSNPMKTIALLLVSIMVAVGTFVYLWDTSRFTNPLIPEGVVVANSLTNNYLVSTVASAASADDSLAKVKAKGRLVVGINAEFAPFEFHAMVNGKDTVVGFDVDMAKDIAKDIGVELELKDQPFDGLLASLQSGQVDVLISGLSATEERRKTVDFSVPYYKGAQVLLTTRANVLKFSSFSDLKKYKIGLQLSSLQDKLMQTLLPNGNYTKIESMKALILSLKSNQIDGIVTTKIVSEMAVAANPELAIADKVFIDGSSLNSPGVAVALRKGATALMMQMNVTIKRLNESGQMQKYVDAACKLAVRSQGNK